MGLSVHHKNGESSWKKSGGISDSASIFMAKLGRKIIDAFFGSEILISGSY